MATDMILFEAGSLGRLVRRVVDRNLRTVGLTAAQIRVLIYIAGRGEANQRDIEDELSLTRATVSSMVDILEGMDLIVREKDSGDGRRWRISLTDSGSRKLDEARNHMDCTETLITSSLTEEEKDMYMQVCHKLRNVLEGSLC